MDEFLYQNFSKNKKFRKKLFEIKNEPPLKTPNPEGFLLTLKSKKVVSNRSGVSQVRDAADAALQQLHLDCGSFYLHLLHLDRDAVYNGGSFYLHLDRDAARIAGVFICICCISIEMQFTMAGV